MPIALERTIMIIRVYLLAGLLALAPVAWADDCPSLMEEFDNTVKATPSVDEETIVDEDLQISVKEMRAKGEEMYKQGKDAECVEILDKAIELLKGETG
ncbi:MAG: hypothetical protein WAL83_06305 [Arenicellales bacterium]